MKSGVDETLELPDMEEILKAIDKVTHEKEVEIETNDIIPYEQSLVYDACEDSDYIQVAKEMDEIANTAQSAFDIVLNKIESVPPKDIGSVATSAQSFLTAKLQAKMFKCRYKLDKAALALKKQKQEHDLNKNKDTSDDGDVINLGTYDRNSLID